jgi:hypothetical protein
VLASNWNLGAGIVNVKAAEAAGLMKVDPISGQAFVVSGDEGALLANFTKLIYRVDGSPTGAAPIINFRASGNLTLQGSLSDGFFEFRDQYDPTYLSLSNPSTPTLQLQFFSDFSGNYLTFAQYLAEGGFNGPTNNFFFIQLDQPVSGGGSAPFVNIPYSALGNSPAALGSSPGGVGDPLGNAVVFPLLPSGKAVASSSFNLTAGSVLASADPLRINSAGTGTLSVAGAKEETIPTAGGLDIQLLDPSFNVLDTFSVGSGDLLTELGSLTEFGGLVFPNLDPNGNKLGDVNVTIGYNKATNPVAGFVAANPTTTSGVNTGISETFEADMSLSTFSTMLNSPIGTSIAEGPGAGGLNISVQTVVRTGTGSINLGAGNTVDLTGGAPVFVNKAGSQVVSAPTTPIPNAQPVFAKPGPAIYTVGQIAAPVAETLTDPTTGASITITPQNLLPGSVFDAQNQALQQANVAGKSTAIPGVLLTDPVYLTGGGNITVSAGVDVLGRQDTGALAAAINFAVANNSFPPINISFIGTLDTPWYVGSVAPFAGTVTPSAAINPQLFTTGLGALGGGSIAVNAGRNVTDMTVVADSSLTTATARSSTGGVPTSALLTMGSGNVAVVAGGNILGGRIDVASGTAQVDAGGSIENGTPVNNGLTTSMGVFDPSIGLHGKNIVTQIFITTPDELAIRIADATADLSAGGSLSILGVAALAPGSGNNRNAFYSSDSGLDLLANGAITVTYDQPMVTLPGQTGSIVQLLPASFISTSIAGDFRLASGAAAGSSTAMIPSAQGQLQVFAGGNIAGTTIGMEDADPGNLPGLFSTAPAGIGIPVVTPATTDITLAQQHNKNPTHADDPEPVIIYADGSIGSSAAGLTLYASKQARIFAGEDIVNMMFFGQNLNPTDITRIVAGRDIIGTSQLVQPQKIVLNPSSGLTNLAVAGPAEPAIQGNTFVIGGPGDFILEAGRNLGPFLPSVNVITPFQSPQGNEFNGLQQTFGGGVISIGNQSNPFLPTAGASLTVMFGVAKGTDLNALRDTYVAPGTAANVLGDYSATLLTWMQQNAAPELVAEFGTTNVSAEQAFTAFVALPEVRQEVFLIRDVYFNELRAPADPNSPSFQQNSRGYAAVNTLFPASLGYTANSLTGTLGSSGALVSTGNLDLRLSTIETQEGGDTTFSVPAARSSPDRRWPPRRKPRAAPPSMRGLSRSINLTRRQRSRAFRQVSKACSPCAAATSIPSRIPISS